MRRLLPIVLALGLGAGLITPRSAQTQSPADTVAIRAAALDYIDGWYTGDAARMRRSLHPDLAKRIVRTDTATGRDQVQHMDAETLIGATGRGFGTRTPGAARRNEVRVLDIFGDVASVRVDATDWVDYLHLARVDGQWVIVNVLWELRPTAQPAG